MKSIYKLTIAAILMCIPALAYSDADSQQDNCLLTTHLSPNIVKNRCKYVVSGIRCRSGAPVAQCLGASDEVRVDFYPQRNTNNILLDKNGIPKSETIYCRVDKAKITVDENGTAYCQLR